MSAIVRCLECGAASEERADPVHRCSVCGYRMIVLRLFGRLLRVRPEGLPTGRDLHELLERFADQRERRAR